MREPSLTSIDNVEQFDAASVCWKCGSDDVWSLFEASGTPGKRCWPYLSDEEHIDRGCRRCQHEWVEWPNDRGDTEGASE